MIISPQDEEGEEDVEVDLYYPIKRDWKRKIHRLSLTPMVFALVSISHLLEHFLNPNHNLTLPAVGLISKRLRLRLRVGWEGKEKRVILEWY